MIGNKEILDGKERDILQNANLKENPFSVPQGYFSSVEEAVHQKIHKEEKVNPLVSFFKTSIALASVFGIVFGLGYGAMYLTDTLDTNTSANQAPVYASNEEENTDEFTISASEEEIEQYLIDSDLSISALAALE
jgi:methyltransferase-like protein